MRETKHRRHRAARVSEKSETWGGNHDAKRKDAREAYRTSGSGKDQGVS